MSSPQANNQRGWRAFAATGLACALVFTMLAQEAKSSSADQSASSRAGSTGNLDGGGASANSSGGSDAGVKAKAVLVIEETDVKSEPPPPMPVGDERRAIGEYIQTHSDDVHDCYAVRLRERPTLQGKLIARFQIGPNGRVIGAAATGVADEPLIACVIAAVRKWEFEKPASGGKLSVAYPYSFKPIATSP